MNILETLKEALEVKDWNLVNDVYINLGGKKTAKKMIKIVKKKEIPKKTKLGRGQKTCPNCNAVIGVRTKICPACNYLFYPSPKPVVIEQKRSKPQNLMSQFVMRKGEKVDGAPTESFVSEKYDRLFQDERVDKSKDPTHGGNLRPQPRLRKSVQNIEVQCSQCNRTIKEHPAHTHGWSDNSLENTYRCHDCLSKQMEKK